MSPEEVKYFKDLIVDASSKRKSRERIVDGEIEWVLLERKLMFGSVNEQREKLGKQPIDMSIFLRLEDTCVGHVDYGHKLAIRCVEMVEMP